jgi:hypothetical protein
MRFGCPLPKAARAQADWSLGEPHPAFRITSKSIEAAALFLPVGR